jgi:hypothetical protein
MPVIWGCSILVGLALLLLMSGTGYAAGAPSKPKVAVFPLAGEASPAFREKVGFALRRKLDREGHYEVIDGPAMTDLVADEKPPVDFSSDPARVTALGRQAEATVLLWGEVDPIDGSKGGRLRLKWLDLRDKSPAVRQIEKEVNEPTDLRFVTEQVAEALPGVKAFEHAKENDQAVQHDAQAEAMWKSGANLVTNGGFDEAGHWQALYESQAYPPPLSDALPEVDKVAIYRQPLGEGKNENVLAMNLSRYCAENNGMACLSDAMTIEPNTRYRLQFRYRSDGPRLHVFVKGYTRGKDINGKETMREIYRRQVPPSEATDGQWVTVTDELNPQQQTFPVDCLRIDLYAYLHPGVVMFDDVVLKAVGKQTDKVGGAAFQRPVTRP